jgi:short-subunit dehydrogenase
MDSRTALITGASSGIGLELARLAAREDCNLVIVSRDVEQLARVAAGLHDQYGVHVRPDAKDRRQ